MKCTLILPSHRIFELLNNKHGFANTQKLLLFVPYESPRVSFIRFMFFLERNSKECGNHSTDFVSCQVESHTVVTVILWGSSYSGNILVLDIVKFLRLDVFCCNTNVIH